MAFGDLKDSGSAGATSTASTNAVSLAGFTADVGDLVYALFVETDLTVDDVTDNLGNAYTALNAGTYTGAVGARAFYSRVTHSGVLTTVTFVAAASANDHVRMAVLFEGPIGALDKNPGNTSADITSPFSCPSTGTLTQADEIVVGWGAADYVTTWLATSPMIARKEQAVATTLKGIIASKVVASTAPTTPAFTAASNPTQAVLGTSTFKKAVTETVSVTKASVTYTGKTVTVLNIGRVIVTQATVTLTGKTVTVTNITTTDIILVTAAAVTLAGQIVTVSERELVSVVNATVVLAGKTVTPANTSASLSIVVVDKADLVVAGQPVPLTDILIVSQATATIIGKAVAMSDTIPVSRARVTFTGQTATIEMSTFQDIPKYIIRGRGSRYGLWTQGNGGTIKGRGSRAFLVMQ